ncbi:MAG: stage II sporulation protein P [Clostridia bacterium]|nr:stage II sporulation protein P [Clostridia bacterium]
MNEKEITTYENEDELERNNIRIERSKRTKQKRKAKHIKLFFALFSICLLLYGGYKLYPYFQSITYTPNENQKNEENSDTPLPNLPNDSNNNNNISNENNTPSNESTIPEGSYPIIEATSSYLFTNESQVEFQIAEDFSTIKANDIYSKYGLDAPLVLITHFSARESYSNGKYYSKDDNFYNDIQNVGMIGEKLSDELNKFGINAIHLNEIYASGSIYNSRGEYEKSLNATLSQFPSICYVINVSRDLSINKDMSMIRGVIEHNEQKLAQISFVSGSSFDTFSENQLKNACFSSSLSSFINSSIDSFVKQSTISNFSLAQDYSPFCIEIEFGSYANSFDEASNSATYFADLFSKYLS